MKAIYSVFFSLCVGLVSVSIAQANNSGVGTVVKSTGTSTILINGRTTAAGPQPRVSYEGKYYTEKKIRRGTKVKPGNVVRTNPSSSVKIIFSNGDHFVVGPSTSYIYDYSVDKNDKYKKKKPTLNIIYGKLRALVNKDKNNPRTNMRVKTKTVVAGVRGTDFYVSFHGSEGTQLKVMRGKVAVKPILKIKTPTKQQNTSDQSDTPSINQATEDEVVGEEIEISTGNAVVVQTFDTIEEAKEKTKNTDTKLKVVDTSKSSAVKKSVPIGITLKPISKEELIRVQSIAVKDEPKEDKVIGKASKSKEEIENEKRIQELEKKATQALIKDITNYTPEVLEKIKDVDNASSEKLNTAVLSNLYKQAPAEKPKAKPSQQDIDSIGKDIYDDYFNIED